MEMETVTRMGVQLQPYSLALLLEKYARGDEATPEQVLDRIAKALAQNEAEPDVYEPMFREALNYTILGGRINASAGVEGTRTTWVNCFVQPVGDSMTEDVDGVPSIMTALSKAAETMRLGGGVGYDFSRIRPKGSWINGTKSLASGPLSYMETFNSMCGTVISAGARRGAQMGILRCDHPDILDFIEAKRCDDPSIPYHRRPLSNFNLSVGMTDALMQAVVAEQSFELVHTAKPSPLQLASGAYQREDGKWVYRTVEAKELYSKIMLATYTRAEPGVVFIDRINSDNNLRYAEVIEATNPCGEEPLPAYGCCDLGHLVLSRFVTTTVWEGVPQFDWDKFKQVTGVLVRMLDNVLDLTPWPLPEQEQEARNKRRIGAGFTALGDALIMFGLRYSSQEGRDMATKIMQTMRDAAYEASVELALERGAFPLFNADKYLEGVTEHSEGTFASRLPERIKNQIRKIGIRNSHLLALAPTGTGSLTFGNNCSSGCEPVFSMKYSRKVLQPDGSHNEIVVNNPAFLMYSLIHGESAELPGYFETAQTLDSKAHLEMIMALAPYVDAAISKTVNLPASYPFGDFESLYMDAWAAGLKGLTTYRPNEEVGQVLTSLDEGAEAKPTQAPVVEESDPDRRVSINALPQPVMSAMRWLDRPQMPDGNPAITYMVECPQGDFAVMVGHYLNGVVHPFETWVNGSEVPRGLGAIAKTLSVDMRSYDAGWLKLKLESLKRCEGDAFDMPMPPTGEIRRMPSAASAFAQILMYHTEKIGWGQGSDDNSLVNAMMFRKEPKAGPEGTLSWTVSVKNPATGDDFELFVKELDLPDGSHRPYSVWMAGDFPAAYNGLCKLLSFDMRIVDPAWIGMKLRKLRTYREPQGDFLAQVPGSVRQASYPSTIAYIADLLLYRYKRLGILAENGSLATASAFLQSEMDDAEVIERFASKAIGGRKCPDCGLGLVKYNGCDKCAGCGYTGSCG
jgi:ribonucleoside-diphosphate reductase alpha chain